MALTGDARDRLEVVGNGVDSIALVSALRRKLGHAQLLEVGEYKKGSRALNELSQPMAQAYMYPCPYHYPSPQYEESSDNCSVM